MSVWTPAARRIGLWSALGVVGVGLAYLGTGAASMISRSAGTAPENAAALGFQPPEPYLTILEALMLLLGPFMIGLMSAVHAYAPPDHKTHSLAALGFMIAAVVLTSAVHFVQLTVVRGLDPDAVPSLFRRNHWPTVNMALDLLAWCPFLGLALLLAAPVFRGGRLPTAIRVGMIVSGTLCVAGVLGPVLGDMRLSVLGILGYDAGFPVVCVLLAALFARPQQPVGGVPDRASA